MKPSSDAGFARLVHRILVVEKRHELRRIAERLGMPYATFYARVKGRVAFGAGEINQLLRELGDVRLVDKLLEGTGFLAVRMVGRRRVPGGGHEQQLRAVVTAVKETALLLHSLERERSVDGQQRRGHTLDHLREAERALAAVRAALPRRELAEV